MYKSITTKKCQFNMRNEDSLKLMFMTLNKTISTKKCYFPVGGSFVNINIFGLLVPRYNNSYRLVSRLT